MRLGILILPEHRWPAAGEMWARAERLGFAHAWTYDHLAWRNLHDSPWYSAVPTLAAAASATSTIRLGTLVASANFRHPVSFARELLTLDDITGGRLTLGVGAGGEGRDSTVLGQEPWSRAERQARFEEFVDMLDRLLTHPEVSHAGRFWTADEARGYPGCVQQPRLPFAVAGTGPRSMRVVARHAAVWVTNGDRSRTGAPLPADEGAAVVADQLRRFEQVCEDEGRDPATCDKLVLTGPLLDDGLGSPEAFAAVVDAYEAAGMTDLVVHWPRPGPPFAGDEAILEAIAPAGWGNGPDTA